MRVRQQTHYSNSNHCVNAMLSTKYCAVATLVLKYLLAHTILQKHPKTWSVFAVKDDQYDSLSTK